MIGRKVLTGKAPYAFCLVSGVSGLLGPVLWESMPPIASSSNAKEIVAIAGVVLFCLAASLGYTQTLALLGKRNDDETIERAAVLLLILMPGIFAGLYLCLSHATQADCLIDGQEHGNEVLKYAYFSFVTHTTLGFGDVSPVGLCRIPVPFQAIYGYVSIAALISFAFKPARKS
ncbi:MAG: ion channel [Pseudomonadota bacterium]